MVADAEVRLAIMVSARPASVGDAPPAPLWSRETQVPPPRPRTAARSAFHAPHSSGRRVQQRQHRSLPSRAPRTRRVPTLPPAAAPTVRDAPMPPWPLRRRRKRHQSVCSSCVCLLTRVKELPAAPAVGAAGSSLFESGATTTSTITRGRAATFVAAGRCAISIPRARALSAQSHMCVCPSDASVARCVHTGTTVSAAEFAGAGSKTAHVVTIATVAVAAGCIVVYM